MLGFKLPININSAYKATSLTDFWHRWHISLSLWLRDYLYIPLGGNRKGRIRTYINLLLTMLLGGLWHGAHLKFVVWGGIHGVGLAIEKLLSNLRLVNINSERHSTRLIWGIITFNVVCLSWIFFRANDFNAATDMLSQIFTSFGTKTIPDIALAFSDVFLVLALGFIVHLLPYNAKEYLRGRFIAMPLSLKLFAALLVVVFRIQFQTMEVMPFIYFRS